MLITLPTLQRAYNSVVSELYSLDLYTPDMADVNVHLVPCPLSLNLLTAYGWIHRDGEIV